MPTVPDAMQTRGPVPGGLVITLRAQAVMAENLVVTFGTEDHSCALCGATDFPLGWTQAAVAAVNDLASIHMYTPMWLVTSDSSSDAISFGDSLEMYAGGLVIRAENASGNSIFGKAMQDATAGANLLAIPVVCCPTYTTS